MNTPTQSALPEPMVRFNLYLQAHLREQLEELSRQSGAPLAEITRRALAAWVQQQEMRPA